MNNRKIALLIDGENISHHQTENILAEAGKHGRLTIKRIYGDWTNSKHMMRWKGVCNEHALRPCMKFSYATGKGNVRRFVNSGERSD